MTEFTYREGPREGPFYSVKGMVDYFSNGTASPNVLGPEFGISKGKLRDEDQSRLTPKKIERNEYETRDDCTKRVMFHPAILSGESGEDLNFDSTKVYTPNHRQDSNRPGNDDEQRDERGILSKTNSAVPPRRNPNITENEVYTGMSWRCRADLLRDNDSTERNGLQRGGIMKNGQEKNMKQTTAKFAPAIPPSKNHLSVLQALKVKVHGDNHPAEMAEEAQTKSEAKKKKGGPLSPRKFSVSKINKARSGPVPKSDDFFSELKQWHNDYSLRQVEKPREITVIKTSEAEIDVKEEKKTEVKKETKKAADDAKKALARVNKELSKKKKEEKLMKKKIKKDAKQIAKTNKANASVSPVIESSKADECINDMSIEQSGKKKKKFWKIPKIARRKSKSSSSMSCMSSPKSVGGSTDSSQKLIPQKYPSLGMSKKTTKVPMKEPEETFNDTLDKFLQLQLEMREDKMPSSSVSSDGKNTAATLQRANTTDVVVETVYSTEEESRTVEDSEASKPKIEPDAVKADGQTNDTQNKSVPELEQRDSWLEKAAGYFKSEEMAEPLLIVTRFEEKDSTKEVVMGRDPTPTNRAIEAEKEEIGGEEENGQPNHIKTAVDSEETDPWMQKIAGFFKKDKISGPPVKVVKVDKFDVDKYEAFAETKVSDKDDGIESKNEVVDKSEAKTIENRQEEGKSVRFTEPTNEEPLDEDEERVADGFIQSHCPCVIGQQRPDMEDHNNSAEESETHVIKESDQKESSWLGLGLGLASAYFMTSNQTEVPTEDTENKDEIEEKEEDNENDSSPTLASPEVEPLATPKASNNHCRGFFSTKKGEQDARSADHAETMSPSQSGTFDRNVPSCEDSNQSQESNQLDNDESILTNQEGTFDECHVRRGVTSKSTTFDDSLITKEDSFNDSLLTNEEGTKVTKIEVDEGSKPSKIEPSGSKMDSLLDLESNQSSQSMAAEERQTESRPCADSLPNRCNATESRSCADSNHKDDPPADGSKSLCLSESKSKTSKSKKAAKPTDVIILRKKSKKSDAEKDTENSSLQANRSILIRKQESKVKDSPLPKAQKKTAKKTVARNQRKQGATLFGRLEADTKKQKKKAKHANTLF